MKDLYIVTYYVCNSDMTEAYHYEVMIGSESVCMRYCDSFDYHNEFHGYGMMLLEDYLSFNDLDLEDVLLRISKFIV